MRRIITLFSFLLACNASYAQTSETQALQLSATVQTTPPKITLHWKRILIDTPTYHIWKKSKTATSWGPEIALLPTTDSVYEDAAVIADSAYEYRVWGQSATLYSTGYMYAAIKGPAIHNRGAMIVFVDSTFSDSCSAGIARFVKDISGDGWEVIRHDVDRARPVSYIRSLIDNDYATHSNVKAITLLGHIAVPYSGDLNPDGHPDHLGAWPADVYYGYIGSPWTDASVNDVASPYPANQNAPGDGKFDQTAVPAIITLQVGRVDFYNMPAFSSTEVQMMQRYLDKDHTYKMDSLNVRHRGIIHDDFGYFSGEAFGSNGWRNMAPLVGKDSISVVGANLLITTAAAASYQWSYGCGGGSFSSAGGIGNTADYAANGNNSIFSMLFGSYFGDWNVQNNFLRAPLCSNPPTLTNCWAGRPNWYFHHMSLGENIGYSARLTQNNGSYLYQPVGYGVGWVHAALMGDPSLRTDYIKPISNLVITNPLHNGAVLNWTASPDMTIIGYHVYRADSEFGYYQRLTAAYITGTTFTDLWAPDGMKYYMVRPVKLQSTPSGAYYNLGIGTTQSINITNSVLQVANVRPSVELSVFPNPAASNLNVTVNTNDPCTVTMFVVNEVGQSFDMITRQLIQGDNHYSLNVSNYAPGMYTLIVQIGSDQVVRKWVKL